MKKRICFYFLFFFVFIQAEDFVIASFGASVTQQKNSIWDNFVKILNQKTGSNHIHKKFGYGGCQICYTSVCKIDEVIESKPDICILDWFHLMEPVANKQGILCLEAIIRKLYLNNIKVIFFFHLRGDNEERQKQFCNFFKSLAQKYGVIIYDEAQELQSTFKIPVDPILRDTVHTTDYGSYFLGELFSEFFIRNFELIMNQSLNYVPDDNPYCHVQESFVTQDMVSCGVEQDKDGYWVVPVGSTVTIAQRGAIVGMHIKVGPNSPWILIDNGNQTKEVLVWDQWAHYERKTTKIIVDSITAQALISVIDKHIDYSECRRIIDLNATKPQYFKVKSFYWIPNATIKLVDVVCSPADIH